MWRIVNPILHRLKRLSMSDNTVHISVDIETLGLRENTVVLSIGAAAFTLQPNNPNDFDKYIETGFHVKFSAKEQIVD
jgi:hypothetical protein